ncbi:MAG TPA: HAD-IIB family hydrolase [Nitrospiraceae bacterium]|nr:HAD-IIB family hydrolase [Nitrospiraceae bacterium]
MRTVDWVIFSDLDGTLLDTATYSYEAARRALATIAQLRIPLVLVSSKTRAEMEPLRRRLRLPDPFIAENGGAVYIPKDYFPFSVEGAVLRGRYHVIEIGRPYADLRVALRELAQLLPGRLQGFGDMTEEEVAQRTGLSSAEARLAKQREYDEPFLFTAGHVAVEELQALAERRGLRCTRGGRFYHLLGNNDKGMATLRLIEAYRRLAKERGHMIKTIGLGDSLNDLPMLQIVDRPVLVQRPDGASDPEMALPNLTRADGIGPVGWNRAVLDLVATG